MQNGIIMTVFIIILITEWPRVMGEEGGHPPSSSSGLRFPRPPARTPQARVCDWLSAQALAGCTGLGWALWVDR